MYHVLNTLLTQYPLQYNFTYNTRVSVDYLTSSFYLKLPSLGLIDAKLLIYMMFQLFQRCSKNNFTNKNKIGFDLLGFIFGKSLFYLYYIIFLLSKQYARKWSCSNVPSFFKYIYVCIFLFRCTAKTTLCLCKISKLFPIAKNLEHWNNLYNQQLNLEQTWNNFTYKWNTFWNKTGTTYHLIISYTIQLGTSLMILNFT